MDASDIRIIRALQGGIPLSAEPFCEVSERAGVSQEEILERIRKWKGDGTIRRFGAILRHQRAGYSVNAMAVWNVPDDRTEIFGRLASEYRAVSHCYQRPSFEGFPYNLYTMIHGKSREECQTIAQEISERTGITDYELLYTTAEFKKSPPVYFAE